MGSGLMIHRRSSKILKLEGTESNKDGLTEEVQGLRATTAVAYINRQGGTRSTVLQDLAGSILRWAELHILTLSTVHLRETLNKVVDFLSRNQVYEAEWRLNPKIFHLIVKKWRQLKFHLFATQQNAQVPLFSPNRI